MRDAFSSELTEIARVDERIVLLMGDIGNHMFDTYKELFPSRFYNCGIAEANMISVAAGLAMSGFRPFVYTFSAFNIGRTFEQVRVDLAFQNLPVVIIGLGGGLTYAPLGPTHYFCEDLAVTRVLPNMTVICPADACETKAAIRAAVDVKGPTYIRIGKKREPIIYSSRPVFSIGKGIIVADGDDICIISTGTILPEVIDAANILRNYGINSKVVSLHTVKPLDIDLLTAVFSKYSLVVTIEEHSLIGGLGSAVAEWLSDQPHLNGRLIRIGLPDEFLYYAIQQKSAREHYSLSAEGLSEQIRVKYCNLGRG